MILTHGANSIKRGGGTPIPSGYEQLWGIGGFTDNSNQLRILPDNNTPPSLVGKTNQQLVAQVTLTTFPNSFGSGALYYPFDINGRSRMRLAIGADANGNYTAASNNNYWNDGTPPVLELGSSYPTTSSFTFVLTTYRNTLNVQVNGASFDKTDTSYTGRNEGAGYVCLNVFPSWQGRPYYINDLKIMDHDSGDVLFHVIPLKKLDDNTCWFWDEINNAFVTSSGLTPAATNPYT
jgi:hypothetical protein